MSFIERAVEQLNKQAPAVEPESKPSAPQPVELPLVAQAKQVQQAHPIDAIEPMPCRSEPMVRIDLAALRADGSVAPKDEERRLAEDYRIIKRPLLKSMSGSDAPTLANLVVVTSAVPGEGKTFTSINLALSLARERNREVLLIDGDVAKRHITHLFGLDDEPGFLDVAGAEGPDLQATILRTDIPSLYLMPAGNQHADATELLRSERTISLLAMLAAEPRRIILIDSPPLLATTEAGVLVSLAGQVIIVVKASETPQEIVMRAVETVPEDKPVSLVLNQVVSLPERDYGYYYGNYGYGRDQGKAAEGSPAPADSDKPLAG